jgi:hypothetical protein
VFESGEGRPLDMDGLRADLACLWKEASSAGKEPAMRACRVNLVVLLAGRDRERSGEAQLDEMMPFITRTYPARVILVRTDGGGGAGTLNASVSALCALGSETRYVCCERITIDVGLGAEPSLPATLLSLLIGELPLVVWVPGEPPLAASWFRSILSAATFRGLAHLTGSFEGIELADFEWLRLVPWRRAIAAAFEPAEAREAARLGLDRVTFLEGVAGGSAGSPQQPRSDSNRPREEAPLRTEGRARQTVLADEVPVDTAASASSLLLRVWILQRAHARTFVWAHPDEGRASHTLRRDVPRDDPTRGITSIRFEGRTSHGPFRLEVPAPSADRPPQLADFVRLIGGQPDHPMMADPYGTHRSIHS